MGKYLTLKQRELYIQTLYEEVTREYQLDPDNYVRKHIEYDILVQLLFGHYDFKGLYFTHFMNRDVKKLLPYIDLSEINWYGINVEYTDFSNTNINMEKFDVQTVYQKSLKNSNFSGLDFSGQNFKGVNVAGAKFIDCNLPANISKAKSYQFAIYDVSEDSIRKRR